jgi:YfiH family protein
MTWTNKMQASMAAHGEWIVPDWPAPDSVRAFVTTRAGGVSEGDYATMNVALRGGDDPTDVARNRAIVREILPANPIWLHQEHATTVSNLDRQTSGEAPRADAAVTHKAATVAVVVTADCIPLFLCDINGRGVAAVHAGWRGIAAGIIENAVRGLGVGGARTLAWMGPGISQRAFEVGDDVRDVFIARDPRAGSAFEAHVPGKYYADLYALARQRLEGAGVESIYGGNFCTYTDTKRFFSYRRQKLSGRMGAFIWIA